MKKVVCMLIAVAMLAAMIPSTAMARDELKNTDPEKYYILLDLKNQIVTVYEKDEAGEYTTIVRRFICTSGKTEGDPESKDPDLKPTPTPSGIWRIGAREKFGKFASFGGEYARYWTQIVGGVYFHSVMFGARDVNRLKSGAFGRLGNKASHGCVRLYIEDAKWLYYYACPGTIVNVTNDEPANRALTKTLKTRMPFKEYNARQKVFADVPEQPNLRAWTVVESADMRTGNGSNDRVIKKLPRGTEVEVLQEGDPWVKIAYDGREGYMKLAYVTYEQGTMQSREDADIVKATSWLLAGPEKNAERIVKMPTYSSVNVLAQEGDWVKVQFFEHTGYVQAKAIGKGWGTIREE